MKVDGVVDARSVDKFGIKLKDETKGRKGWFNADFESLALTEAELVNILSSLRKGDEISMELSEKGGFIDVEVTKKSENENGHDREMIGLTELLSSAHSKYGDALNISTELIELDKEKCFAMFRATISCKLGTFEDYGDATKENLSENIKESYIRMASTRAIVRALRWATNSASVGAEEIDDHNKEGKKTAS